MKNFIYSHLRPSSVRLAMKFLAVFFITVWCSIGTLHASGLFVGDLTINGVPNGPISCFSTNQLSIIANALISPGADEDFKYEWTLYKDGVAVASKEVEHGCGGLPCFFFPSVQFLYPAAAGNFQIKLKVSKKVCFIVCWYKSIGEEYTNTLPTNLGSPSAYFVLNGGSPASVCETGNVTLDGTGSTCEDRYRVTVTNTNSGATATSSWYEHAAVPSNLNIKSLASSIGVPLTAGNVFTIKLDVGNASISYSRNIRILSNQSVSGTLGSTASPNLCVGQTVTYTTANVPGGTYSWNIPSNMSVVSAPNGYTRVLQVTSFGAVQVEVTVGNLCSGTKVASQSLYCTPGPPTNVTINAQGTHCLNQIAGYYATANYGATYQWSYSGSLCVQGSLNQPLLMVGATGQGTLYLTISNGCGQASQVSYTIYPIDCGGGSNPCSYSMSSKSSLMLSPNPIAVGSDLSIKIKSDNSTAMPEKNARAVPVSDGTDIKEVTLTEANSRKVHCPEFSAVSDDNWTMSTRGLPPGIYILTVETIDGSTTQERILIK